MKILSWKFGVEKGCVVKYETREGIYTLKTEEDAPSSLYTAAADIAEDVKHIMGLTMAVSLSAITINSGDTPTSSIVLDVANGLPECAELKCPKLSRAKAAYMDALAPEMMSRYTKYEELNLAIDTFLEAVLAFVKSKPSVEPTLFDNAEEQEDVPA
jgi:hypothetical protein